MDSLGLKISLQQETERMPKKPWKNLASANLAFAGDGNVNGFGLEFYIETPGDEIAETIHEVKKSWQFQLLYTVSQLAAGETPSSSTFTYCLLLSESDLKIPAKNSLIHSSRSTWRCPVPALW